MPRIRNILFVPICIVILSLLVSGCGTDDPTELTQEDLEQIMDDAVTATTEADSFAVTMTMNLNADMTGEEEGGLSAEMTGDGVIDTANEAMQMNMTMSFTMDMGFMNMSMEDIGIEAYVVDGWQYQHITVPDMADEWTRMPATHDDTDMMDPDYMKDQVDLLKSAAKLRVLRSESIDGVNCYVIEVEPDAQKVADWISEQSMITEQIPADELQQFEDLMDDVDITVWIAKDTDYLMKFDIDATIDTSELETASTATEMAENALVTIGATITMSDYNKSVDITLPPAAADARETTPEDIFGEGFGDLFTEDMFDAGDFEGMFDGEDFNPEAFSEWFTDEDLDFSKLIEFFEENDIALDELFETFQDGNIDMEKLSELFEKLDISPEKLQELYQQ